MARNVLIPTELFCQLLFSILFRIQSCNLCERTLQATAEARREGARSPEAGVLGDLSAMADVGTEL